MTILYSNYGILNSPLPECVPFIDKDGEGVGGAGDNVEGLALLQLRLQGL